MAYQLEDINFRTVADPKGFVEESDAEYQKKVEHAADLISENRKKSPIVLLSGPSGSGKTTTAMKIAGELNKRGIGTHYVSMDNYFKTIDPATAPRTTEGEIDSSLRSASIWSCSTGTSTCSQRASAYSSRNTSSHARCAFRTPPPP